MDFGFDFELILSYFWFDFVDFVFGLGGMSRLKIFRFSI